MVRTVISSGYLVRVPVRKGMVEEIADGVSHFVATGPEAFEAFEGVQAMAVRGVVVG